jgi:hypothetical protein
MGYAGASSQPMPMFQRGMYNSEVDKVSSEDWRSDVINRVSGFAFMHKILTLQSCCVLNSNYCPDWRSVKFKVS